MRPALHRRQGFTLIELLIAIGIMSVLASITIIALKPAKHFRDAQDARRQHTEKELSNAVYQYLIDEGDLPDTSISEGQGNAKDICIPTLSSTDCHSANGIDFSVLTPEYIHTIDRDPAEACETLTGYRVSLEGGRPKVESKHEGLLPGQGAVALVCPDPTITSGLLASWRFADPAGSTVAIDSSGSQHSGTLVGFAPASDWITISGRPSIDCSGHSGHITVANASSITPTDALTVLAWVHLTGNTDQTVVDRSGASHGFSLDISAAGTVQFSLNGVAATASGLTDVADGSWHLVAGRYDRSSAELSVWVDGVSDATASYASAIDYATDPGLFIAARDGTSRPYNGYLAGVRIYDKALSAEEIALIAAGEG